MDLFSEMCSVICEQVGIDVKKITKQSRLKEDLGIDSVDFVQLLWELKKNSE